MAPTLLLQCEELLTAVTQRVRPAFHAFGHIHEGYGITTDGTTTFINAACCTHRGHCTQPPIVFDVPKRTGGSAEDEGGTMTGAAPWRPCCCWTCLQELDGGCVEMGDE